MRLLIGLHVLATALATNAVTIYTTLTVDPYGNKLTPTSSAEPAFITGLSAYNATTLTAPGLPNPMPALNFPVQLYPGGMNGLSIKQKGNFMGFSIELSVSNQILGRNSSRLQVPFLNYVSNIKSRAGMAPIIRVGGNSQEQSQLFFTDFPNHEIINKTVVDTNNPTSTPEVNIDADLFYTLRNISSLLDVYWYLGLPFADATNTTGIANIAAFAEEVLGDHLIALQMANEPDLYGVGSRKRPDPYTIQEYMTEWSNAIAAMEANPGVTNQEILLGPSICCAIQGWTIDDIIAAGYLTTYSNQLAQLSVQHYPNDNCVGDNPPNAQDIYPSYLMHSSITGGINGYLNASAAAQQAGKQFIMFETNTASCAGFPGLSDSFAAALWGVDWALQLAFGNFSGALFHFGGQDASYNPFTPPPANLSSTHGWSTGPIYYSNLLVAEALGPSNASQVLDLLPNNNNPYTPGYVIYENGNAARVVLINYMNDPSGNSDYTANILIGGGQTGLPNTTPSTVYVRYLLAPDVTDKYNISWAGQTFGGLFQSDGRLQGNLTTETVQCDPNNGCPIRVKAPSAALIFLTTDAVSDSTPNTDLPQTFESTYTSYGAGPTVNQAVLATSNGRGGPGEINNASTSSGKDKNAAAIKRGGISILVLLLAGVAGALSVLKWVH